MGSVRRKWAQITISHRKGTITVLTNHVNQSKEDVKSKKTLPKENICLGKATKSHPATQMFSTARITKSLACSLTCLFLRAWER